MKTFISGFLKLILKFFYIFPVRNTRIFFDSYGGKQYSCSPKYISEALPIEYEKIWFLRKGIGKENDQIKYIRKKGIKYFYYLLTSKVLVTNVNFSSYVPFRKKQVLINTWHGGGAYKYAFYGTTKEKVAESFLKFSFILSSCYLSSKYIFRDTFSYNGQIINSGLPRNDLFFKGEAAKSNAKNNVFSKINLKFVKDLFIVLYAPTYKDYKVDCELETIDFERLRQTIIKKFGKDCLIMVRSHHFGKKICHDNGKIIDVSNYDDMQELLFISDMLITDYSSSLWDFSLTNGCAFIFAPDLEKYRENRGFYMDIFEWGFPVAKNNDQLEKGILNFDRIEYELKIKQMHKDWISYENGDATEQVISIIKNKTLENGKRK